MMLSVLIVGVGVMDGSRSFHGGITASDIFPVPAQQDTLSWVTSRWASASWASNFWMSYKL